MKQAGLHEVKAQPSAIEAEAKEDSTPVTNTRHGRIASEIHPYPESTPTRKLGCLKSANFFIADDFADTEAGFEDFFVDSQ